MEKKDLDNIAETLLFDSYNINDVGLFQGKMGIALFFYHYSRFCQNDLYKKYADKLLDDILCELNVGTGISFYYGLSGIAWGICHLYINNFITCDVGNVLEDINLEIVKVDVERMNDSSLSTGFKGILFYINTHLLATEGKPPVFDEKYMNTIKSVSPEKYWVNENRKCWIFFLSDLKSSTMPWQKGLHYLLKQSMDISLC